MRALIALTVGMGVLILIGTTVLVVLLVERSGTPARGAYSLMLDEPSGTRLAGVAAVGDRMALELQGGGPDRVVMVDPRSGAIVGRVSLAPVSGPK